MYIYVLTDPHLLQSGIWFTAVHKILETMGGRAFWSSQIPPPAGKGTTASTKPGQTWLRFHKPFVLCYIRTSTYFLIKGSHDAPVWFALHQLIRIVLIIILSFEVWVWKWVARRHAPPHVDWLTGLTVAWVPLIAFLADWSDSSFLQPSGTSPRSPPRLRDSRLTVTLADFFIAFGWISPDPLNSNTSIFSEKSINSCSSTAGRPFPSRVDFDKNIMCLFFGFTAPL